MNRHPLRADRDFQTLLDALSIRQYLTPHELTQRSLARVTHELSVCPQALEQAVEWLGFDGLRAIGRVRRTELMQLARAIHRFWLEQAPAQATEPAEGR